MSDQFIGIDTKDVERQIQALMDKLEKLPPEAKNMVADEVLSYMRNVMQEQPSYKYVSRKAAYGQSFQSEKQRRWFFANLDKVTPPYSRTQAIRKGWQVIGKGYNSILVNEVPGVQFVQGDGTQSRHEAMVGWKTVGQQIKARADKIFKTAEGAVKKAIKKLRLE